MQAAAWLGKNVVISFSKIDKQLEKAGLFKKLEPNPLPESVLDKDGDLVDECVEVRKGSWQLPAPALLTKDCHRSSQ